MTENLSGDRSTVFNRLIEEKSNNKKTSKRTRWNGEHRDRVNLCDKEVLSCNTKSMQRNVGFQEVGVVFRV